jgi:hypothetical protein
MKQTMFLFALCLGMTCTSPAQTKVVSGKSCSVVVFNHQWLPQSYNADTQPTLSKNATGLISVHETGDIAKKGFLPMPIDFKVGIWKKSDRTTVSFSEATYREIEVNDILTKCQPGDKIIILLKDGQPYSLPHHQIEVI